MGTLTTVSKFVQTQLELGQYAGQRKHWSQLSEQESERINTRLASIKEWEITSHTFDRLREKGINATVKDIVSVIGNASIIEYKIDYNARVNRNEERVVLRANDVVNDYYNLNVVYSLTTNKVITVWINRIDDLHSTLDWSIYNSEMKVF